MYGIIEILCWVWVVMAIHHQSELIEILEKRTRRVDLYDEPY